MGLSDQSTSLFLVTIFLLCLSLVLVSLRCWVRISIKRFGLDDWLISIGLILFLGTCVPVIVGSYDGIGTLDIHLNPGHAMTARKCFLMIQIFYCVDSIFVKSGICVGLIRASNKPTVRYPAYVVIAISSIAGISTLVTVLSVCKPIEAQWNPAAGKCLSPSVIVNISYFISAVYILTDFSCVILAIVLLWNVQLNWKVKSTAACILSLGFFASTATIVRLRYLSSYFHKNDYLYGIADIVLWSIIELGLGLSAGSAAALRPLLRLILDLERVFHRPD
ncbi:hypothetical protein BKA64DRAFT_682334 [Cadophora sp. MPI-SDFR-AT-0126]|nr:hypothetical protein BKA64DRAFT_682334 [Leotiomycetes sp. MPI-SDFR-AT-0126]